jgi:hypothetical protein
MASLKFLLELLCGLSLGAAVIIAYFAVKEFIKNRSSDDFKTLTMGTIGVTALGIIFSYIIKILF